MEIREFAMKKILLCAVVLLASYGNGYAQSYEFGDGGAAEVQRMNQQQQQDNMNYQMEQQHEQQAQMQQRMEDQQRQQQEMQNQIDYQDRSMGGNPNFSRNPNLP